MQVGVYVFIHVCNNPIIFILRKLLQRIILREISFQDFCEF